MLYQKTCIFGSVETVVCPYANGWRGEHDRGVIDVWSRTTGYPGYVILSVANTSARCPPRPSRKRPSAVAEICMKRDAAITLRDALNKAIEVLPETTPSNFGDWEDNDEEDEDYWNECGEEPL